MLRDDDHSPADAHGRDSSERSRLDPFVVATGDAAPRDQRDLMERPFFSLAKAKRTAPILYESAGVRVEVFAGADCGMATIWDADVLIWAASQIVAAENNGLRTSRFFRFTPYQLLMAVDRATGARDYRLLKNALIPVITAVGVWSAFLIGGTVLLEEIFAIPGLGRLVLGAIQSRDYPIIQGAVLFMSFGVAMVMLLADLLVALVDPRVKFA